MCYFYVLYSLKDGRPYKGSTSNLLKRISQHNAGRTRSTKHRRPLILLFYQEFETKEEALKKERFSKTLEGGIELRKLLEQIKLLDKAGQFRLRKH